MSDLDDFFAKKDRKKSKSTKKFSTTDEVAKKLEDNAKKSEKSKKERPPEGDETTPTTNDQDEWKDFEEEKKDYSGLKIGNLTISSPTEDNGDSIETNTEQQDGGDMNTFENDKKSGPWRRVDVDVQDEKSVNVEKKNDTTTNTTTTTTAAVAAAATTAATAAPKTGGTYVPPSLRNQSQTTHVQPSRLRGKTAPDIHNEEFFPTLSKTNDHRRNRNEASFEVVQHNKAGSHRIVEQAKLSSGQGPKLSLENRYNTLSDS